MQITYTTDSQGNSLFCSITREQWFLIHHNIINYYCIQTFLYGALYGIVIVLVLLMKEYYVKRASGANTIYRQFSYFCPDVSFCICLSDCFFFLLFFFWSFLWFCVCFEQKACTDSSTLAGLLSRKESQMDSCHVHSASSEPVMLPATIHPEKLHWRNFIYFPEQQTSRLLEEHIM